MSALIKKTFFLVLILCFLTGCVPLSAESMANSRLDILDESSDEDIAISRLEALLEAIVNKDSEPIFNMLSKVAQEANNVETGISYLFSLLDGPVESWDSYAGILSERSTSTRSLYRFIVYTETSQYLFTIIEYLKDTSNSDNVGVYSITAFDMSKDEPTFFDAGIYAGQ